MVERQTAREYSVVILGSTGVGKSSLCLQFCRSRFPETYQPTIEDYYRKPISLAGHNVMLDILDTAGQESSLKSSSVFITQALGFILVYDITRRSSFTELIDFRDRVLVAKDAHWVPMVIVGNKSDLNARREVTYEEGRDLAQQWRCDFYEVSAKNKLNHEAPFTQCASLVYKNESAKTVKSENVCCNLL